MQRCLGYESNSRGTRNVLNASERTVYIFSYFFLQTSHHSPLNCFLYLLAENFSRVPCKKRQIPCWKIVSLSFESSKSISENIWEWNSEMYFWNWGEESMKKVDINTWRLQRKKTQQTYKGFYFKVKIFKKTKFVFFVWFCVIFFFSFQLPIDKWFY